MLSKKKLEILVMLMVVLSGCTTGDRVTFNAFEAGDGAAICKGELKCKLKHDYFVKVKESCASSNKNNGELLSSCKGYNYARWNGALSELDYRVSKGMSKSKYISILQNLDVVCRDSSKSAVSCI